jgi:hypothetical protein
MKYLAIAICALILGTAHVTAQDEQQPIVLTETVQARFGTVWESLKSAIEEFGCPKPQVIKVIEPAEEDEECRTEPSMGRPCAYVLTSGIQGRIHVCRPGKAQLTWCNWSWTKHSRVSTHTTCPRGKMCIRCTRACLKDQTEPDDKTCSNKSSGSDSDSDESES